MKKKISLIHKVDKLQKDLDQHKRGTQIHFDQLKMGKDYSFSGPAVAEVTNPNNLIQVAGPISPREISNSDPDVKVRQPVSLELDKIKAQAALKIFQLLSDQVDHKIIESLLGTGDIHAIHRELNGRRIRLRFAGNDDISAKQFGTFCLFLVNSGACKNSKIDLETFITSFFNSGGNFTGLHQAISRKLKGLDHPDFMQNPIVRAYKDLIKQKKINALKSDY